MYELYKDMIFDLNIKKPYNNQQVYLYDLSQNKQKFITDALIENKIQLIENLIKCKCINLDYIRNLIIPFATKNNHWKIIYLILNDERFVQTPNGNYLLGWACNYGYYKIVKHLLTKAIPEVDPGDNNNNAIILASKNGHYKIVELLLNDIRSYSNFKTLLKWILKNRKINILKIILKINKKNKYYIIVKSVLKYGNIADYTLLLEQRIDNMYILKYATKIDKKDIILLMAELIYNPQFYDPQFYDPIINDKYLLKHACKYGYIDIVKLLLLSDNRIDPTFDNNYAIRCACENEKFEIFDLLSRLHRIKYDQDLTDKLLTLAIKNDKPQFIRSILLYANQSTNLINLNNYCINLFNKLFNNNDYICILEVLLKYYQHHLNQNIIDKLFKISIKGNKLEIVKILLKYDKVDPSINKNYPIKTLYIDNNIKMAKLLIQNEKFKFDNIDQNIMNWIFSS